MLVVVCNTNFKNQKSSKTPGSDGLIKYLKLVLAPKLHRIYNLALEEMTMLLSWEEVLLVHLYLKMVKI